ncbi:uncharacterized protein (UPF0262 family) [Sphingomonas jejuensis]|jgi:uncharacterized protein (UPF0262 family)|uniref:UPF0262 protein GGR88_000550 n=1 Tax=Sphingomonas jejuensis TaxID=904715 RepID=A0ABX0XJU8_9SPHN|nr:UPF0262 family protein [Sphingomonas jejuensis]NJC33076.1 uncharacterized protein (UPF0262 family) [Sphingomonas jejuensis]
MSDPRIIAITLDERTIIKRSEDIEQEKRVAIDDLIAGNHFAPNRAIAAGHGGPYRIKLRVEEGRLAIDTADADGRPLETVILSLARFRRPVKDYFAICDSYYRSVRSQSAEQTETIDMARRGIHNEAAELLRERLAGKIDVDFETARRLFTLLCVLHIKQ